MDSVCDFGVGRASLWWWWRPVSLEIAGDGRDGNAFGCETAQCAAREAVVNVSRQLRGASVHSLARNERNSSYLVSDLASHVSLGPLQGAKRLAKIKLNVVLFALHTHANQKPALSVKIQPVLSR